MLEKGYIQVYTGNGKGKTTAAFGLSLRAVCAGNKVFIGQFMKGQDYSELKAPTLLPGLTVEQFGNPLFVRGNATDKDREEAAKGLSRMAEVLASGVYDLVVLDEMNTALHFGLVPLGDVLALLDKKPPRTELVLTGRNAKPEIIDRADLVTEMREIKHYYTKGVSARVGIES